MDAIRDVEVDIVMAEALDAEMLEFMRFGVHE
ncbi:hypothetical protein J2W96_004708 [Variovorax guangxiensis]|nr:hypothetical protein [Variovorax guangxiensis]